MAESLVLRYPLHADAHAACAWIVVDSHGIAQGTAAHGSLADAAAALAGRRLAASIPTLFLYNSVRGANYILGAGPDTKVFVGGTLELIVALALHRRMTEPELRHAVGDRVYDAFAPNGLLTQHDAEDPDGMVHLGVTDHHEPAARHGPKRFDDDRNLLVRNEP